MVSDDRVKSFDLADDQVIFYDPADNARWIQTDCCLDLDDCR